MDLIPQIPREESSARAPSFDCERPTPLHSVPRFRAGEELAGFRAGAAVRPIVWMMVPAPPHPEGVEGREQHSETVSLAKREQVVPELDHWTVKHAGGLFEIPVISFGVFQHETQAGDAVA